MRDGLQNDETVNILRGFLATSLEDLVSMGRTELCHFLANFLTFVTVASPGLPSQLCNLRSQVHFPVS